MNLLEWLRLPRDQWKPARAIFTRGRRPTLDLAIEIERQIRELEAQNRLLKEIEERLNKKVQSLEAERDKLRDALEGYAQCSEGCTCGDGWGHEQAIEALKTPSGRSV